jgi:hypothetical protein
MWIMLGQVSKNLYNYPMQKIDEKIVSKFKNVTDSIGLGIDDGIIVSIAYLNELHFWTSASCEGHLDRALPYAWIDFMSDFHKEMYDDPNSILNIVESDTRNKVNTLEKELGIEKFEEKYQNWAYVYFDEIKKHEKYKEYTKLQKQLTAEFQKLESKISGLLDDFCLKENVSRQDLHTYNLSNHLRLNFCTAEDFGIIDSFLKNNESEKSKFEFRKKYKEKSDTLVQKFENYLINRYGEFTL